MGALRGQGHLDRSLDGQWREAASVDDSSSPDVPPGLSTAGLTSWKLGGPGSSAGEVYTAQPLGAEGRVEKVEDGELGPVEVAWKGRNVPCRFPLEGRASGHAGEAEKSGRRTWPLCAGGEGTVPHPAAPDAFLRSHMGGAWPGLLN